MHKLILFVKTHKPDFIRVQKLLESIDAFNRDQIPVYLSVNDDDFKFFKRNISGNCSILKDSDIVKCKPKDGWRRQAIVKPQVYKLGICENYLCVDSDAFFIRPFGMEDFLYNDDTPYTIMHEHKSFMDMLEIIGFDSQTIFHVKALEAIRKRFGTHGKNWDYGPNPHLWSCKVWKHFMEEYLAPKGYSFESFYNEMEETALPHEAAIYGEYLLKTRLIDILPVEGFFKVFHYEKQFQLEEPFFDIERLRKNYMGIIMQSNWFEKDNMPEDAKSWWQKFLKQ